MCFKCEVWWNCIHSSDILLLESKTKCQYFLFQHLVCSSTELEREGLGFQLLCPWYHKVMYYPGQLGTRMLLIVYLMEIIAYSLVQMLKKTVNVKIIMIHNTSESIPLGCQTEILVHFRAGNTSIFKRKMGWEQVFRECSRW